MNSTHIVAGIGDDAAAFIPVPGRIQLLTTDMLIEGIHFNLQTTTPWQLGYKSIAVNLSDIAAMGGEPRHVVVSIALPQETSVEFVTELYAGMKSICGEFAVNIIGGDTVSSLQGVVINVAATGDVDQTLLQRRSGAVPGDLLVVTGTLGDSAGGLGLLSHPEGKNVACYDILTKRHLLPCPQVKAAGSLAAAGATSMNDVSDGLASEANEIAKASGVGLRIEEKQVPLSSELLQAAEYLGENAMQYALYGGEDYQLLFTISPENYRKLEKHSLGTSLTVIGEVIGSQTGVRLIDAAGNDSILEAKGYNHFR